MRGRKAQPTALKIVKGNPGHRPYNTREPKPKRAIPEPPAHLPEKARLHWGRFSVLLDRMGVLTEADGAALEQLCQLYQEMIELRLVVEEKGRTYLTKNTNGDEMSRPTPEVAMLADCDRRFRGYLSEFGLTPSARVRVHSDSTDTETDPAEGYF